MHIAYITPEYPSGFYKGNVGGIGTFTKNLAEQLVQQQHQVTVFVHSQLATKVLQEHGVTVHLVQKKAVKGITWYTNRRHFKNYVNTIITQEQIDIIEAPEWTGFTAFMKFNCPLIMRLHGSDTYFCDLEQRKVKTKNKFFEKKALNGADKIVGVSQFVADKTKELFKIYQKITVIHNAIDVTMFQPNHQGIQPKTLLYFGTLVRKKGVLALAKMFNELVEKDANVQLTLLGRDNVDVFTNQSTLGMFKDLLSEQAKQKVTHIQAVPYQKVIHFIQQYEIVVLPSFAEAFPMTWLEAMALEKKLITSNIGWANELMIDGETGYTVNPNDTELFVHKVLALLNDKEFSEKMAKNARERIVKAFEIHQAIEKNSAMYQSILK